MDDTTKQKRTRYIPTWFLIGALFAAFITYPPDANATYEPAPEHYVRAALQSIAPHANTYERKAWAICRVFGKTRCRPALNVSWCESSFRPWARNGQYLGAFQMGSSERARFGHGKTIWQQAHAAKRYFDISWWNPWQCKPNPY